MVLSLAPRSFGLVENGTVLLNIFLIDFWYVLDGLVPSLEHGHRVIDGGGLDGLHRFFDFVFMFVFGFVVDEVRVVRTRQILRFFRVFLRFEN